MPVFIGTEPLFLKWSWWPSRTPWNCFCLWFGNRSCSFSIGTVSRCSPEPSRLICWCLVNKRLSSSELLQITSLDKKLGAFLAPTAAFFLCLTQACQLLVLVKMPWQTVSSSSGGFKAPSCSVTNNIATFLVCLSYHDQNISKQGQWCDCWFGDWFVLMAMILVDWNIAFSCNPARGFGPAVLVGGAALQQVWFSSCPIVGGVLAALVAKLPLKQNTEIKSLAPQLLRNRAFRIYTLRKSFKSRQHPSVTSKQAFELTSSVLSITLKALSVSLSNLRLAFSLLLIFIEYEFSGCQFSLDKDRVGRGVTSSLHTWFQVYRSCSKWLKCPRVEWIFPYF